MEIFDDPEVFQNIDRLDDLVKNILEKSWKFKKYLI
jgi:hypothetical protein